MANHVFLLALLLSMASALPGQLTPGDMGVTLSNAPNQFLIVSPTGGVRVVPVGSFGSLTGVGIANSILWDPNQPNSFILGGFGFVGRASFSGGVWTYNFIAAVANACQMSFNASGMIIVADGNTDQVLSVNPVTGTVTVVASSPLWGGQVTSGAVDPINGDIYVGAHSRLFRIPVGGGGVQTVAVGLGYYPQGIAFDLFTNEVVTAVLTTNRLYRFDAADRGNLLETGGLIHMRGVAVDPLGDFIIPTGSTPPNFSTGLYRVPNAGGSATLIADLSTFGNPTEVAVVGVSTPGSPAQFQSNTFGASLFVNNAIGSVFAPATVSTTPNSPVSWTLTTNIAGGTFFDLLVGRAPLVSRSTGAQILSSGGLLNIDITDPTLVLLDGGFQTLLPLPGTLSGSVAAGSPTSWSFQMAVIDPALLGGIALSQPSRLVVQ